MPTFTAVELDRLLEPRSRSSMPKILPVKVEKRNPLVEKGTRQFYISPALYVTPQVTPIPDSPSSYTPSPYIVNHKRRGPRLLRSSSHGDISELQPGEDVFKLQPKEDKKGGEAENGGNGDGNTEVGVINGFPKHNSLVEASSTELVSSPYEKANGKCLQDTHCRDDSHIDDAITMKDLTKSLSIDRERDGDFEDFFDPQDSISVDSISVTSNTEFEDSGGIERLMKNISPLGEYFDAYEDLSGDGTLALSRRDIEAELHAIRLNLLMEIEKRKQAEEALSNMQNQWQRVVQKLSLVGLSVSASLMIFEEKDEELEVDPAEELCRQVVLARAVAGSVGRGSARAEAELVMESQIKLKNFEIARLYDKLQYYETVNHEMSQRNQETVEVARRRRNMRKRRQRWIWSSIGFIVTLGTAALAWSHFPDSRVSTYPDTSSTPQDPSQRNKVSSAFQEASSHGLNVARTWAFSDGGYGALQYSPGSYNEQTFQGLDFVIAEARKYGIKLILSLVNNYENFGGKKQYVQWARNQGQYLSSDDDFFSNPTVKGYYKNHVKTVLTRYNKFTGVAYKDDPTIFAWELMNEPRCQSDTSGRTIQAWITEMAAHVKSIDGNHLLEIGLEGFYGQSSSNRNQFNPSGFQIGTDFISNNQIPGIDFATVHSYPDQWLSGSNDQTQVSFLNDWLNTHIQDSQNILKKPLLLTEFGKSWKDPGYNTDQRDSLFRTVYYKIYSSASSGGATGGGLFWQLLTEGMDSYRDGYEIVLNESPSTANLISQQSQKLYHLEKMYARLRNIEKLKRAQAIRRAQWIDRNRGGNIGN